MTENLSIGDFSRMTQLSVKTLRHYHEVGLVTPVFVDPATGYRYYRQDQVPTTQVVRRLRDLDMPIADVRSVRALLDRDDLVQWWQGAVSELQATVAAGGLQQTGALGALYGFDIFAHDRGEATVFIPVHGPARPSARVQPLLVPAAELALIRHAGPHDDVDLAYSALGDYARRHEISVDGPLREYYHRFSWDTAESEQWDTELCWPVFRADADADGADA